jgi:hypothetical protein
VKTGHAHAVLGAVALAITAEEGFAAGGLEVFS